MLFSKTLGEVTRLITVSSESVATHADAIRRAHDTDDEDDDITFTAEQCGLSDSRESSEDDAEAGGNMISLHLLLSLRCFFIS